MCLLLYIATDAPVEVGAVGQLTVEEVEPKLLAGLRSVFSKPSVRFVGVDGGCSCDFRHILAEEPIEYFDGMFDHEGDEERAQAEAVVSDLLVLVQEHLQAGVELYPMWDNGQATEPKGASALHAAEIRPDRFFFIEDYLYTLRP